MVNCNVSVNRFRAEDVAKARGGTVPNISQLFQSNAQKNMLDINTDTLRGYWLKEWSVRGKPIKEGEDLKDEDTRVLIPGSALKAANKLLTESGKAEFFGTSASLLVDPGAFKLEKGLYVFENPTIELADESLFKGVSSFIFYNGIWPLYFVRSINPEGESTYEIRGGFHPSSNFLVAVSTEEIDRTSALADVDIMAKLNRLGKAPQALVSAFIDFVNSMKQ